MLSLWRDSRSRSKRQRRARHSFDDANRKLLVPRFLPLPAGTLTQLEMFQKRLNVLGKTLGHTPSLGVFCWLEVTDFDRFFGFLFLVLHVCYLSFAIR